MEYRVFRELFLKAERLEKERPGEALEIYRSVAENYFGLVKKCYIGDRDYGIKYRVVFGGPENYKCLLDYRSEHVEAMAALSKYAVECLEKDLKSEKFLKEVDHS